MAEHEKNLSIFTLIIIILCSCTNGKTNAGLEVEKTVGTIKIAEQQSKTYMINDVIALQDFLLAKETPDFSGKDYYLNDDDRWDTFDLCLMKREVLKNYNLLYNGIYSEHKLYGTSIEVIQSRVVWLHDLDSIEWDGNGYR